MAGKIRWVIYRWRKITNEDVLSSKIFPSPDYKYEYKDVGKKLVEFLYNKTIVNGNQEWTPIPHARLHCCDTYEEALVVAGRVQASEDNNSRQYGVDIHPKDRYDV